jgi:hypothetical protein
METSHRRAATPQHTLLAELRRALESADFAAFARLYADDAVLEEVSSLHPPAHPVVVKGRDAILELFEKDLLRDPVGGWSRSVRSSALLDALETDDAIAFTEERTYAAGDRVLAQHVARKKGGRIEHDRVLVAWDEAL